MGHYGSALNGPLCFVWGSTKDYDRAYGADLSQMMVSHQENMSMKSIPT